MWKRPDERFHWSILEFRFAAYRVSLIIVQVWYTCSFLYKASWNTASLQAAVIYDQSKLCRGPNVAETSNFTLLNVSGHD